MNNICITGRLTSDPVLRNTPTGTAVASYRVAVDRAYAREGQTKTDFIQVAAFGKPAEFVCNYFHKGQMIAVTGELHIDEYTTQSGEKRVQPTIYASTQGFCGDRSTNNNAQNAQPRQRTQARPAEQAQPKQQSMDEFVPVSGGDGDLPF